MVRIGRPKQSFDFNVPLRCKNHLQINDSVSYRTAARKDEQAGIKDLRDLARNAFLEEHWVFLPAEKLWEEVSYDEKPGSTEIDLNYLEDVIRKNDDLAVYHIHLRSYLKTLERKGYDPIPEMWLVAPSFEDIALMVYFSSLFYKCHPEGKIVWNICSPLGITQYALTDKGIKHYAGIKQDAFFLEYFYPGRAKAMDPKSISTFDIKSTRDVDDLIHWVNVRGKGYLKVRFLSYNLPSRFVTSFDPN